MARALELSSSLASSSSISFSFFVGYQTKLTFRRSESTRRVCREQETIFDISSSLTPDR
jgi:hypothetical protein